jgi:hypothetical protein
MEIRIQTVVKKLVLLVAAVSLLGCASHSHRAPQPKVPAARRFESYLLKPSHRRNCPITIVRERGVAGSGLNVYLDGEQIARMAAGEAHTIYVSPRWHLLSVRPLFSPPATKRLEPENGRPITVRIIDRNGNFELVVADRAWLAKFGRTVSEWANRPL